MLQDTVVPKYHIATLPLVSVGIGVVVKKCAHLLKEGGAFLFAQFFNADRREFVDPDGVSAGTRILPKERMYPIW